jgi:glycosyltransferase involved in cell wall biosynthesis
VGQPASLGRMHIVQTVPELNQGGVERGVVELNRELVKRGHRSTVISAGGKLVEEVERDGGQHITFDVCSKNPLTFMSRAYKLQRILSSLKKETEAAPQSELILHARSRVPAWLFRLANKRLKIPFVTTVHGFNSVSGYSKIMTSGDRVICVSNPVKAYIQHHYETSNDKITVIHRGIDPAEFDPDALDQKWMDSFQTEYSLNDHYVVSSVGRITELKDYETFIRAVYSASQMIPNIRGLIVGGVRHDKQAYFDRLKALTEELGAQEQIIFAGSQSNMPEIYALSDQLISCSKKPESFGRSLIEAMAMNTPVIATRHGGALDIIKEGRTGDFFTPGSANELALAIRRLHKKPAIDLREYVLAHFTQKQMIEQTLAVYEELPHQQRIRNPRAN